MKKEDFYIINSDKFQPFHNISLEINEKNASKIAQILTGITFILHKRFNEKSKLNLLEELKLNEEFKTAFICLVSSAKINMKNKKKAFLQIENLLNELTQTAIKTKKGGKA